MNIGTIVLLLTAPLATTALACSSGSPDVGTSTSPTSSAVEALSGTYDFVLASSDVGKKLRAQCDASGGGDTSRAAQCWSEVEHDAANEKIRFSRNEEGQLVFTSFGVDNGKEDVFVELPIAMKELSPGIVVASAAGWPRGSLVGQLTNLRFERRVERGPDDTIALTDPSKGRLVYSRAK